MHGFDFFMLPFLDRIGQNTRFFMGIRQVMVGFRESFQSFVTGSRF